MMRYRNTHEGPSARRAERGFTLYEILVSTLVAGLALLVTMLVASQMGAQLQQERGRVSSQDNARVALDEIVRTLRGAGSQTDQARGQGRFVYAGPWTIGLNANLYPQEDPDGTAEPAAVDPALENAAVPLGGGLDYTPPRAYTTGAETIVLSIDSSRDGTISSADAGDDEEEDSQNPRDFVLKAFVYGSDGTANSVQSSGLALVRGPGASTAGLHPEPLFRYWIDDDNDAETPAVLHGDGDGDGELSQAEISGLGPVASEDLALITRIDVTVTAENEKAAADRDGDWSILRSSVSFRNRSTTSARVSGVVYNDANESGVRDAGEVPLSDVVVRCSNGYRTKTNTQGVYGFVLPPGTYTIQEVDLVGYRSTTPNLVAVNPIPGDYVEVDFGDVSLSGTGFIRGLVYHDRGRNGKLEPVEDSGIAGVRVFLDTGVATQTDSTGKFLFVVSVGNYTVTEVDSAGYASSTPNVVDVNLAADGDSVYVEFGDYLLKNPGYIEGIVYLDGDNDGVHDRNEDGIANVTITLDGGEVTVTDASGNFRFVTDAGTHEVTETDPPDHSSSTVNTVTVGVLENLTTYVEFGDIGVQDVTFQEIQLAETERALSIVSADLVEDNRSDLDLVLGTHYVGGSNDILVWWNQRKNSSTPNSAIFSQTPSAQRVVSADVNAVAAALLDANGNADIVTGLGTASNNICVWITQTGSNAGLPPNTPNMRYTAALAMSVNDVVVGDFDGDAYPDLAVGTTTGLGTGRLEIWHGLGGSSFQRLDDDIYTTAENYLAGYSESLGEVRALAAADFTGDGVDDLVVGTRRSTSFSIVYLFVYGAGYVAPPDTLRGPEIIEPEPTEPIILQDYSPHARFTVYGSLQDVLALDMKEDDRRDVDILVASELQATSGLVTLWHNRGNNHFGGGETADTEASDQVDPHGAPMSLVATTADNDVFPDIVVGTRNSTAYDGQVLVYRAFGFLPSDGLVISSTGVGEVVTITAGDFNKDAAPDLATGTRTSASTGKVVIFFNQRSAL